MHLKQSTNYIPFNILFCTPFYLVERLPAKNKRVTEKSGRPGKPAQRANTRCHATSPSWPQSQGDGDGPRDGGEWEASAILTKLNHVCCASVLFFAHVFFAGPESDHQFVKEPSSKDTKAARRWTKAPQKTARRRRAPVRHVTSHWHHTVAYSAFCFKFLYTLDTNKNCERWKKKCCVTWNRQTTVSRTSLRHSTTSANMSATPWWNLSCCDSLSALTRFHLFQTRKR